MLIVDAKARPLRLHHALAHVAQRGLTSSNRFEHCSNQIEIKVLSSTASATPTWAVPADRDDLA
jgi:hypothetical protein